MHLEKLVKPLSVQLPSVLSAINSINVKENILFFYVSKSYQCKCKLDNEIDVPVHRIYEYDQTRTLFNHKRMAHFQPTAIFDIRDLAILGADSKNIYTCSCPIHKASLFNAHFMGFCVIASFIRHNIRNYFSL